MFRQLVLLGKSIQLITEEASRLFGFLFNSFSRVWAALLKTRKCRWRVTCGHDGDVTVWEEHVNKVLEST